MRATLFIRVMGAPTPQEAIACAYREHGTQLWRGIYAFSGGRADVADDSVAEAFARALEGSGRIRSLLPWLYRVAFRHAAKSLKTERGRSDLSDQPDIGAANLEHDPALGALTLLAPRQRAIVFLFYYADFSINDIAQATGASRVAVRVQLHRARETLRRHYGSADAMRASAELGGANERELV